MLNSSSPSSTRTTSDVALQTPEESETALLYDCHLSLLRPGPTQQSLQEVTTAPIFTMPAYGTPWWVGGYKTWGKGKGSQSQRSGNVSICTEQHTSLLSLASNLIPLITVPFPFLVIFSFCVFVSFDLEATIFPQMQSVIAMNYAWNGFEYDYVMSVDCFQRRSGFCWGWLLR